MVTTDQGAALVTGAGGGIGRAIATALAATGRPVAACDIDDRAEGTVEAIARGGGTAAAFSFDVADAEAASRAHQQAAATLGPIGVVVANAGIVDQLARVDRLSPEGWEREVGVNLSGAFYAIRPALAGMKQRPGGRIVVISSIAALIGFAGQVAYAATKAGLLGLVRTLALEMAPFGATANAVLPGFIATDKVRSMPAEVQQGILARVPLGRYGQLEEVAALVGFLVSPVAAFITGAGIPIDGGFLLNGVTLARDRDEGPRRQVATGPFEIGD